MSIKVNHYAAKTIEPSYYLNFEALVIELSVAVILGVMAVGGYNTGLWVVWVPCGIISICCFGLVLYSLYQYISDRLVRKAVKPSNNK
ncbi:hypothetical protein [Paraglaciecola sp. 2405UD69-4]|uniref:hypothetical protein n=1 Tax=Paraglaciecola sp. 2405UD69-4 TaxID=3391836 RepID=UPI0039C9D913